MKDYTIIEKWDDDYNGAAIYSLVDENGKRYIGQASHLQDRLETHRRELAKAWKCKDGIIKEGFKLAEAGRKGTRFRVEILKKISWDEATINVLRYWENYYLERFGGLEKTYNTGVMYYPNWNYEGFNNVVFVLDFNETDADILAKLDSCDNKQGYIKSLIREDMSR